MKKNILGYRWKEGYCEKYEAAANSIIGTTALKDVKGRCMISYYIGVNKLQQAGVLDLWFEPVYDEQPQYKVGDWVVGYVNSSGGVVYFIGRYASPKQMDNWIVLKEHYSMVKSMSCGLFDGIKRHATEEEIKTRLLAEAKTRGYGVGVKVKPLYETPRAYWTLCGNGHSYTKDAANTKKEGFYYYNSLVYFDGKWAEILPSTPQIEVNGYKAEFFDEYVKFGCATINKDVFLTLDKINPNYTKRSNRKIESVKIGKGKFTKEQIAEIANHYKNTK